MEDRLCNDLRHSRWKFYSGLRPVKVMEGTIVGSGRR